MSKRAEEAALKAYPVNMTSLNYQDLIELSGGKTEIVVNTYQRLFFQEGYELAEKDTIERVVEWLQGHSNDYIFRDVYMGKEELKISSQMFEDLKKAMEDEE